MQEIPDLRALRGPHVFVDSLETVHLSEADRHHLTKSLRLRCGDPMTICDGAGSWSQARFGNEVELVGDIYCPNEASSAGAVQQRTLAVALAKGSKPELVTQKATELGVDRLIFFEAKRSVVKWDRRKADKAIQRLAKVAREAAMQSKRLEIPAVSYLPDFAAVAAAIPNLVRADFGGRCEREGLSAIAIGPEGGWDDTEKELVNAAVDMTATVLRCETAAIYAATILCC